MRVTFLRFFAFVTINDYGNSLERSGRQKYFEVREFGIELHKKNEQNIEKSREWYRKKVQILVSMVWKNFDVDNEILTDVVVNICTIIINDVGRAINATVFVTIEYVKGNYSAVCTKNNLHRRY